MSESRDITAEHARTAAEMEADVGAEHIADVYAKGLLAATEQRRSNGGGRRRVRRRDGRSDRPLPQVGGRFRFDPGVRPRRKRS